MTRAYPEGTVKKLVWTFILDTNTNQLMLEDTYTFSQTPKSLEESFITYEKVTITRNGQSVQIGPKRNLL